MTHKIINKNNMNKIILATLSAILFMGTSVLTSCNKDDDGTSPISKKVTLNDAPFDNKSTEVFARNIAEAILENPEIINEIHTGISSVVSYGLDENLTFFDILNTEESVFFESNADFENLRNAIDVDMLEESGFYAENYYGNLNIYWGYHDNWDGSEMPIICYLDDNHSSNTAKGYSLVNGNLEEVEISEDKFDQVNYPVIIINFKEINYSVYPDFKNGIRSKAGVFWPLIIFDTLDVDQEFIDPKPETIYECSIVKMKSSGTQYDYFWAGGSEFKIQVIRPESIYGDTTMTSVAFELTRKKIKNESSINLDVKIHGDWKSECGNVYVHFSEEDWGNGTMSIPINFSYSGFSISTTLEVSNDDDIIFSDQIMRDNFFNRVLEEDKKFLWGQEEMTGKIRMYESYQ